MKDTSGDETSGETRTRLGSSTVAIGTATIFIVVAASLSFVADDGTTRAPGAWALRGSIAAEPSPPPVPGGTRQHLARSDLD